MAIFVIGLVLILTAVAFAAFDAISELLEA